MKQAADLGALVQQRYGITVRLSEAAARAAMSRYEGEEIVTVETEQERRRNEQIADAKEVY